MILIKTRFGNKQGMKRQLVAIDWAKMRYSDVDGDDDTDKRVREVQKVVTKSEEALMALSSNRPRVTGIPADVEWD
ncbi:hypothetical protein D3C81_2069000 [compost metagenome]